MFDDRLDLGKDDFSGKEDSFSDKFLSKPIQRQYQPFGGPRPQPSQPQYEMEQDPLPEYGYEVQPGQYEIPFSQEADMYDQAKKQYAYIKSDASALNSSANFSEGRYKDFFKNKFLPFYKELDPYGDFDNDEDFVNSLDSQYEADLKASRGGDEVAKSNLGKYFKWNQPNGLRDQYLRFKKERDDRRLVADQYRAQEIALRDQLTNIPPHVRVGLDEAKQKKALKPRSKKQTDDMLNQMRFEDALPDMLTGEVPNLHKTDPRKDPAPLPDMLTGEKSSASKQQEKRLASAIRGDMDGFMSRRETVARDRQLRDKGFMFSSNGMMDGRPIGLPRSDVDLLDIDEMRSLGIKQYKGVPIEEAFQNLGGEERLNAAKILQAVRQAFNNSEDSQIEYLAAGRTPELKNKMEADRAVLAKTMQLAAEFGLTDEMIEHNESKNFFVRLYENSKNAFARGFNMFQQSRYAEDMLTGTLSDSEMADLLEYVEEGENIPTGSAAKKFREYQAKDYWDAAGNLLFENPEAMPELFFESMSSWLPAYLRTAPVFVGGPAVAGAAMGLAGGPLAPATSGSGFLAGARIGHRINSGVASLTLEYSGMVIQGMQELGIDYKNPKVFAAAWNNEEIRDAIRTKALKKGIPIAIFDSGSAMLASRVTSGLHHVGKSLKGGKLIDAAQWKRSQLTAPRFTRFQRLRNVGSELAVDGALGGAGEYLGQLWSKDPGERIDYNAVAAETLVGFGPGTIGAGVEFSRGKPDVSNAATIIRGLKDTGVGTTGIIDLAGYRNEFNTFRDYRAAAQHIVDQGQFENDAKKQEALQIFTDVLARFHAANSDMASRLKLVFADRTPMADAKQEGSFHEWKVNEELAQDEHELAIFINRKAISGNPMGVFFHEGGHFARAAMDIDNERLLEMYRDLTEEQRLDALTQYVVKQPDATYANLDPKSAERKQVDALMSGPQSMTELTRADEWFSYQFVRVLTGRTLDSGHPNLKKDLQNHLRMNVYPIVKKYVGGMDLGGSTVENRLELDRDILNFMGYTPDGVKRGGKEVGLTFGEHQHERPGMKRFFEPGGKLVIDQMGDKEGLNHLMKGIAVIRESDAKTADRVTEMVNKLIGQDLLPTKGKISLYTENELKEAFDPLAQEAVYQEDAVQTAERYSELKGEDSQAAVDQLTENPQSVRIENLETELAQVNKELEKLQKAPAERRKEKEIEGQTRAKERIEGQIKELKSAPRTEAAPQQKTEDAASAELTRINKMLEAYKSRVQELDEEIERLKSGKVPREEYKSKAKDGATVMDTGRKKVDKLKKAEDSKAKIKRNIQTLESAKKKQTKKTPAKQAKQPLRASGATQLEKLVEDTRGPLLRVSTLFRGATPKSLRTISDLRKKAQKQIEDGEGFEKVRDDAISKIQEAKTKQEDGQSLKSEEVSMAQIIAQIMGINELQQNALFTESKVADDLVDVSSAKEPDTNRVADAFLKYTNEVGGAIDALAVRESELRAKKQILQTPPKATKAEAEGESTSLGSSTQAKKTYKYTHNIVNVIQQSARKIKIQVWDGSKFGPVQTLNRSTKEELEKKGHQKKAGDYIQFFDESTHSYKSKEYKAAKAFLEKEGKKTGYIRYQQVQSKEGQKSGSTTAKKPQTQAKPKKKTKAQEAIDQEIKEIDKKIKLIRQLREAIDPENAAVSVDWRDVPHFSYKYKNEKGEYVPLTLGQIADRSKLDEDDTPGVQVYVKNRYTGEYDKEDISDANTHLWQYTDWRKAPKREQKPKEEKKDDKPKAEAQKPKAEGQEEMAAPMQTMKKDLGNGKLFEIDSNGNGGIYVKKAGVYVIEQSATPDMIRQYLGKTKREVVKELKDNEGPFILGPDGEPIKYTPPKKPESKSDNKISEVKDPTIGQAFNPNKQGDKLDWWKPEDGDNSKKRYLLALDAARASAAYGKQIGNKPYPAPRISGRNLKKGKAGDEVTQPKETGIYFQTEQPTTLAQLALFRLKMLDQKNKVTNRPLTSATVDSLRLAELTIYQNAMGRSFELLDDRNTNGVQVQRILNLVERRAAILEQDIRRIEKETEAEVKAQAEAGSQIFSPSKQDMLDRMKRTLLNLVFDPFEQGAQAEETGGLFPQLNSGKTWTEALNDYLFYTEREEVMRKILDDWKAKIAQNQGTDRSTPKSYGFFDIISDDLLLRKLRNLNSGQAEFVTASDPDAVQTEEITKQLEGRVEEMTALREEFQAKLEQALAKRQSSLKKENLKRLKLVGKNGKPLNPDQYVFYKPQVNGDEEVRTVPKRKGERPFLRRNADEGIPVYQMFSDARRNNLSEDAEINKGSLGASELADPEIAWALEQRIREEFTAKPPQGIVIDMPGSKKGSTVKVRREYSQANPEGIWKYDSTNRKIPESREAIADEAYDKYVLEGVQELDDQIREGLTSSNSVSPAQFANYIFSQLDKNKGNLTKIMNDLQFMPSSKVGKNNVTSEAKELKQLPGGLASGLLPYVWFDFIKKTYDLLGLDPESVNKASGGKWNYDGDTFIVNGKRTASAMFLTKAPDPKVMAETAIPVIQRIADAGRLAINESAEKTQAQSQLKQTDMQLFGSPIENELGDAPEGSFDNQEIESQTTSGKVTQDDLNRERTDEEPEDFRESNKEFETEEIPFNLGKPRRTAYSDKLLKEKARKEKESGEKAAPVEDPALAARGPLTYEGKPNPKNQKSEPPSEGIKISAYAESLLNREQKTEQKTGLDPLTEDSAEWKEYVKTGEVTEERMRDIVRKSIVDRESVSAIETQIFNDKADLRNKILEEFKNNPRSLGSSLRPTRRGFLKSLAMAVAAPKINVGDVDKKAKAAAGLKSSLPALLKSWKEFYEADVMSDEMYDIGAENFNYGMYESGDDYKSIYGVEDLAEYRERTSTRIGHKRTEQVADKRVSKMTDSALETRANDLKFAIEYALTDLELLRTSQEHANQRLAWNKKVLRIKGSVKYSDAIDLHSKVGDPNNWPGLEKNADLIGVGVVPDLLNGQVIADDGIEIAIRQEVTKQMKADGSWRYSEKKIGDSRILSETTRKELNRRINEFEITPKFLNSENFSVNPERIKELKQDIRDSVKSLKKVRAEIKKRGSMSAADQAASTEYLKEVLAAMPRILGPQASHEAFTELGFIKESADRAKKEVADIIKEAENEVKALGNEIVSDKEINIQPETERQEEMVERQEPKDEGPRSLGSTYSLSSHAPDVDLNEHISLLSRMGAKELGENWEELRDRVKHGMSGKHADFVSAFVDISRASSRVVEQFIKDAKIKDQDLVDALDIRGLWHQYYGKTDETVKQAQLRFMQPIEDALRNNGVSLEDFGQYLIARAAPSRNIRLKKMYQEELAGATDEENIKLLTKLLEKHGDNLSGVHTDDAIRVVKEMETGTEKEHIRFQKFLNDPSNPLQLFYDMNLEGLKFKSDSGLIRSTEGEGKNPDFPSDIDEYDAMVKASSSFDWSKNGSKYMFKDGDGNPSNYSYAPMQGFEGEADGKLFDRESAFQVMGKSSTAAGKGWDQPKHNFIQKGAFGRFMRDGSSKTTITDENGNKQAVGPDPKLVFMTAQEQYFDGAIRSHKNEVSQAYGQAFEIMRAVAYPNENLETMGGPPTFDLKSQMPDLWARMQEDETIGQKARAMFEGENAVFEKEFRPLKEKQDYAIETKDIEVDGKKVDGLSMVRRSINTTFQNDPYVFVYRKNGVPHMIKFKKNERGGRVVRSLKNLRYEPLPEILKRPNSIVRFMASMFTSKNPIFWFPNLSRDLGTMGIHLTEDEKAKLVKDAFNPKMLAGFKKGIWKNELKMARGEVTQLPIPKEDMKSKDYAKKVLARGNFSEMYQFAKQNGAKVGYFRHKPPAELIENFRASEKKMSKSKSAAKKAWKGLWDYVDAGSSAFENSVRMAAFWAAIKNDLTVHQAANISRNITVDFNQKGELSQILGSQFVFFSASVNSADRMVQTFKRRGVKGSAKFIAKFAGAAFLLATINRLMDDDDEEEKATTDFDTLSSYKRDTHAVIKAPGGNITIPVPLGYNAIWAFGNTLADAFWDTMSDEDTITPAEFVTRNVSTTMNAFNPVGGSDLSNVLTPSWLKPFAQWDEDFLGRPRLRPNAPFEAPKPTHMRALPNDHQFLVDADRKLNEWMGGNDQVTGSIGGFFSGDASKSRDGKKESSVTQLHKFFSNIFGGPYDIFTGFFAEGIYPLISDTKDFSDPEINKMPLLNRFYREHDHASYLRQKYYHTRQIVKTAEAEVKAAGRDKALARRIQADRKDLLSLSATVKFVDGLRSKIRAEKKKIENSKLSAEQKMQRIAKLEAKEQDALRTAVKKAQKRDIV